MMVMNMVMILSQLKHCVAEICCWKHAGRLRLKKLFPVNCILWIGFLDWPLIFKFYFLIFFFLSLMYVQFLLFISCRSNCCSHKCCWLFEEKMLDHLFSLNVRATKDICGSFVEWLSHKDDHARGQGLNLHARVNSVDLRYWKELRVSFEIHARIT